MKEKEPKIEKETGIEEEEEEKLIAEQKIEESKEQESKKTTRKEKTKERERSEIIDFADPERIGLNKQINLALLETDQKKVAKFNSQDNVMLKAGEKESFTTRDLNEELKEIKKVLNELGYVYQINISLSPKNGSITKYNIYLSKKKEYLEAFLKAEKEGNNREIGLLLGYPKTAVDAYGTAEAFKDFEKEIPFQEYQKIREEGLLPFINFKPSRRHWREEMEQVRKWQDDVREKFPTLAGVISMIERNDLIEEAEKYLKNNLKPEVKKIIFENYSELRDVVERSSIDWVSREKENAIMEQILAKEGEDIERFRKFLEKSKLENQEIYKKFLREKKVFKEGLRSICLGAKNISENFLVEFYKKAKQAESEGREINRDEILKKIEEYKTDLRLKAAIYRSLKKDFKRGDIKPEDLQDVTFGKISTDKFMSERARNIFKSICDEAKSSGKFQLIPVTSVKGLLRKYVEKYKSIIDENEENSINEALEMLDIYSKNYESNPKLQKKLVEGFIDKIISGSADVNLYIYKNRGEIIAFNRFDQRDDQEKYFGSFNVRPEIVGSAIGNALLENSLEKETSNNETIKADCLPGKSISSHYIEKAGFVVRGITRNYEDTGETVFNIERSPQKKEYQYKNYEPEKLILEAEFSAGGQKDSEAMVLKFKKNSPELIDTSEELINKKGYVMTRYLFEGDNVYCAFERGGN